MCEAQSASPNSGHTRPEYVGGPREEEPEEEQASRFEYYSQIKLWPFMYVLQRVVGYETLDRGDRKQMEVVSRSSGRSMVFGRKQTRSN